MKKALILNATAFLVFGLTTLASATLDQFSAMHHLATVPGFGSVSVHAPQHILGTERAEISLFSNFPGEGIDQQQLVESQLCPTSGDFVAEATMALGEKYGSNDHPYDSNRWFFGNGPLLFAQEAPAAAESGSSIKPYSILWFLGAGLLGLVGVRRRRRG